MSIPDTLSGMLKYLRTEVTGEDADVELKLTPNAVYEMSLLSDDQVQVISAWMKVQEARLAKSSLPNMGTPVRNLRHDFKDAIKQARNMESES